jgi:hypothetical protein
MTSAANQGTLFAWSVFLVSSFVPLLAQATRAGDGMGDKQYEYQEDLKRYIGNLREGQIILGNLDARGNFVPLPRVKPIEVGQPFSGPAYTIINRPLKPNEPVYEYRSGVLIKGTLDTEGNFLPEVGSKVLPFKDYRYGKDAPRIYNLPGKFVEKAGNGTKQK